MGMRTYPQFSYGLYIKQGELKEAADKVNLEEDDFVDTDDRIIRFSEADGEAFVICDESSFYVDEDFYIAELNRFPTLFSKAYENYEEAIEELRNNFSDILPVDFDYRGRFVKYEGTIFC